MPNKEKNENRKEKWEWRKSSRDAEFRNFSLFSFLFSIGGARGGQAVLTSIIFLLFASVAFLFSFSSIALKETRSSRVDARAKQSYFLAEAAMEDVLWRIENGKQYGSGETFSLDGSNAAVTVAANGRERIIESGGDVASAMRKIKTVVTAGTGASFHYGVQVGDGGIFMENTSKILGSVYSNGGITGNNSPEITGDAFAAASSVIRDIHNIGGDARANRIQNTEVGRNATATAAIAGGSVGAHGYADTFSGGTVNGNAYYKSSISATTTVNGQKISIPEAPADLAKLPMPISDAQLDEWESEAAAGGVISSPCPYKPAHGSTVGPVKVSCDVEIDGTKIVTLGGTLWVSGNFEMGNSAQLKLAPSFGDLSGIVIADRASDRLNSGKIEIENSAQIFGSGQSGSYIMVVSRNNSAESGGNQTAIDVKNSSATAIFYAPHGEILFQNSGQMKEATAWKLHAKNSVQVVYESGLNDVQFSSGPTSGWSIQSWSEIK